MMSVVVDHLSGDPCIHRVVIVDRPSAAEAKYRAERPLQLGAQEDSRERKHRWESVGEELLGQGLTRLRIEFRSHDDGLVKAAIPVGRPAPRGPWRRHRQAERLDEPE